MKKIYLFLVFIVLLCSCSLKGQNIYTVDFKNKTFTIDTINKTISYQDEIYKYDIKGSTTTIIFPDSSEYWSTQQENFTQSGWSNNYNESKYISGSDLIDVLSAEIPKSERSGKFLTIIFFLIVGGWNAILPHLSWYLSYGWKYKNSEPSRVAIILIRTGGIILLLLGLVYIFI